MEEENQKIAGRVARLAFALHRAVTEEYAELAREACFLHRGFSEHTIRVLMGTDIDLPEKLLFMSEGEIRRLPGVGQTALADVFVYRGRFATIRSRKDAARDPAPASLLVAE